MTLAGVFGRWRGRAFILPLAALAALLALLINETAYQRSTTALESLGERGAARLRIHAVSRGLIEVETGERG